jgi:hypothetical protein
MNLDESTVVVIYNKKRNTHRVQNFTRRKLIGRTVLYTGVDGVTHFGELKGFSEDGDWQIVSDSNTRIKPNTRVLIVEE